MKGMIKVVMLILKDVRDVLSGLVFEILVVVKDVNVMGGVMVDMIVKQKIKKWVVSKGIFRLISFGVMIDVVIVQVVVVGIFIFNRMVMYMVKNKVSNWDVFVRLSSRFEK